MRIASVGARGLLLSVLAFACTDDATSDEDLDLYPQDRVELADDAVADDVDGTPPPSSTICIGPPQGSVSRLYVDVNGRVRARGSTWAEFPRCPTSISIRLLRDNVRIDSQLKYCAEPGCISRLLSASNPPGAQRFCAVVRSSPTGSILDKKCITR